MNLSIISGRVGSDAELTLKEGSSPFSKFSVAVDVGYGENKSTMWVNCLLFGQRAEKISQYIKKGTMLMVTGEFRMNIYTNREGVEVCGKSPDLFVSNVEFLPKGNKEEGLNPSARAIKSDSPEKDDDIPF